MFFRKKKVEHTEAVNVAAAAEKQGNLQDYLYSMSFLSRFILHKKNELVDEEVKTFCELDKIKDGYNQVIENNARFMIRSIRSDRNSEKSAVCRKSSTR